MGKEAKAEAKSGKKNKTKRVRLFPAKVTNRRHGPLYQQMVSGGASPKTRRTFVPFHYRRTAWQIDLKPTVGRES